MPAIKEEDLAFRVHDKIEDSVRLAGPMAQNSLNLRMANMYEEKIELLEEAIAMIQAQINIHKEKASRAKARYYSGDNSQGGGRRRGHKKTHRKTRRMHH